jgi:hypothetical protein
MAKRKRSQIEEQIKIMRRQAREEERAAGILGHRRKSGEMGGLTKAGASREGCRKKSYWDYR